MLQPHCYTVCGRAARAIGRAGLAGGVRVSRGIRANIRYATAEPPFIDIDRLLSIIIRESTRGLVVDPMVVG